MTRYNVELNNYLQKQNQLALLHWGEEQVGEGNNKQWKLTCYINQEVKGVGISTQKGSAKEMAAKEALAKLGLTVG